MRLYLSSYYLGDNPSQFASLFAQNKKVAIIMNAGDNFGPAKRPEYLRKEVASLRDIGLEGEELDLRDYFNDHDMLLAKLQQYGGVWVMGGNSFILRRAMRQSGFDTAASTLVRNNQLVYGGFSAGAVVATQTLRGIDLDDNPNEVPAGYSTDIIWEGLGFYEKSIAPHFKSNHPESAIIDEVVAYFERESMPYIALHDGEAITITTSESPDLSLE